MAHAETHAHMGTPEPDTDSSVPTVPKLEDHDAQHWIMGALLRQTRGKVAR